ncbi:MAG: AAA family ATPase, partial [Eggerthellaceae bacterium]|nr:AAA family ATPase [Eggerthellaceae bacterium]
EGVNKQAYNPLFIYGKSGLGKTHLLRAIQNYIAQNDPDRLCVYKDASTFMSEYVSAMQNRDNGDFEALRNNYHGIDVLIIDDIQTFLNKTSTITFFFDLFNYLSSNGKQIVLAADRSPAQLGMGKSGFDERITSRLGSGFSISIQVPSFELKLLLIKEFYRRQKEDALRTHIPYMNGTITDDDLRFMAERAGNNIRDIEGFVQSCIIMASRRNGAREVLTRDDILRIAGEKWPMSKKQVTIAQIQRLVETYYDVSHNDLVGDKRNKELMEPRHIAIWLSRELTDSTLADIGKRFGGRSHATIKHSISWVERQKKEDKTFYDQISRIQDTIIEGS